MLEFIVTGQVPGTDFVVTLPWVIAAGTILIGAVMLRREHAHHDHRSHQTEVEELAI